MLEETYHDIDLGRRLIVPEGPVSTTARVRAAWPWIVLATGVGCLLAAGALRTGTRAPATIAPPITRYVPVEVERVVEKKVVEPVEKVSVVKVRDEELEKRYQSLSEEHARLKRAYEHLSSNIAEFERRAIVGQHARVDDSLILCE
jgi:hypothetical protein